jgi:membrane protease YdiL (CAAX protease family)
MLRASAGRLASASRPAAIQAAGRLIMLGAAMAGIALLRAALTTSGTVDGLLLGTGYGLAWLTLGLAAGWRPAVVARRAALATVGIGALGGLALVVVALAARHPGPSLVAHAAPFVAWAAVTSLVAVAEEVVLRGVFLDVASALGGPLPGVLLAAVAFALIHVPLDGWGILPVDIGAGLFLGGLRLASGGVVAPAAAHVVADLATWWF